jgi:tight adherence protein B
VSGWIEFGVYFAAITLGTAVILLVIREYAGRRRAIIEERLGEKEPDLAVEELLVFPTNPAKLGAVGRFDAWFQRLVLETGLAIQALSAFLLLVTGGLLVGGGLFLSTGELLPACLGMLLGMLAALGVLFYLRHRRLKAFDDQLPEVMDLVARAVRAGQSLEQAIDLIAKSGLEPAAREFGICARQLAMGLSMEATLRSLVDRIPLRELRLFSAAIIMQRRTGGSLANTLERFARAMRERHGYRRQLLAATAAGRWSSRVMVAVAVFLLIYLFGFQPEYIHSFISSRTGQIVFAIALVLQAIGVAWVFALTRPEY